MKRFSILLIVAWLGPAGAAANQSGLTADSLEYVLAVSWQPAFCLTSAGRDKPECLALTAYRFDATHFVLHGLWPDDLDDTAILSLLLRPRAAADLPELACARREH